MTWNIAVRLLVETRARRRLPVPCVWNQQVSDAAMTVLEHEGAFEGSKSSNVVALPELLGYPWFRV